MLHGEVIACIYALFEIQAKSYGAGKVRSEKEASRVARENGISLVTVLPVIVVGAAPATRGFNSSSLVLSLLAGERSRARSIAGRRVVSSMAFAILTCDCER